MSNVAGYFPLVYESLWKPEIKEQFIFEKKAFNPNKNISKNDSLIELVKKIDPYTKKLKTEFRKESKNKAITIEEFQAIQKKLVDIKENYNFVSFLLVEQDSIFENLLGLTKKISSNMVENPPTDSNPVKNSYLSILFKLNKKYTNKLIFELEEINKTKAGVWSKVPIINGLILNRRAKRLVLMNKATSALAILSLRLELSFDKEFIKKEIDQTYEVFSKLKINKSTRKYDATNKYLGKMIRL